jgi:hypothetical protein
MSMWVKRSVPWLACLLCGLPAQSAEPSTATIDRLLNEHWQPRLIKPAAIADETTLLRRVTLDLVGRVPTPAELDALDKAKEDRYKTAVQKLIAGPEFNWYFANVLDEIIQERYAGGKTFVGYLRGALHDGKSWETIFREVMTGPWDNDARKPAAEFLELRVKNLDNLTVDTARAFFGVDISCARCHDHPLVKDWKRDHYYGMAAFFVRSTTGKGVIIDKSDGEAKFAGKDGKEKVAPMMFLTGKVLEPEAQAKDKSTRRDVLVKTALDEKKFFSRAFVNRMWNYFFGRGLVDPVDQMHSANPASMPALLDQLGEEFASSGYDIRNLVTAIVLSRAYRLDSRHSGGKPPDAGEFAVARLRPLSSRQLARSLVVALGDGGTDPATIDKQANDLMPMLDPRTADFQSSAREALFVSNADAIRKLLTTGEKALVARLAALDDNGKVVKTAYRTLYNRPATANELSDLESWLSRYAGRRREACEDLIWSLAASAEFRFNH